MSRFSFVSMILAATMAASAQTNSAPVVPQPSGLVDIVSLGNGAEVVRTLDVGNNVIQWSLGTFQPTYISEVGRAKDGSVVALGGDKIIVANGTAKTYSVPSPRYFLRPPSDPNSFAIVLQDTEAPPKQVNVEGKRVTTTDLENEELFNQGCNHSIVSGADQYCLDSDNGKLYRARPIGFTPAKPYNAELFYERKGLVAAKPYKDGLVLLVASFYECAENNAVQIPDTAVFCYMSGTCPQVSFSEVLFIDGGGKVVSITKGVTINRGATLSVFRDTAYVVESKYNEKGQWTGDYVSRLDLKNGLKTFYYTPKFAYTSLWVN